MTSEESGKEFNPKLIKNVMVPMRDGIRLACDLIMPEEEGRYPGILIYHPYRKDDLSIANNDSLYLFAKHGYVGIRLDVRGTGSSEGYNTEEYSMEETSDCIDAINWFAKQDWCTGKLGMFGFSYSGQTSMIAALNAPEPLKAIACAYFSDDRYSADCHYSGGSVSPFVDYAVYGPFMILRKALPPYPEVQRRKLGVDVEGTAREEQTLDNFLVRAPAGGRLLASWIGKVSLQ